MPATVKNLVSSAENQLEAGSTFYRRWQLMNDETGLPHNLLLYTIGFKSSFRQNYSDGLASFIATIVVVDGLNGIIDYTIDADATTVFAEGKSAGELQGVWDLEGYSATKKTRFLMGAWEMTSEATIEGDTDPA